MAVLHYTLISIYAQKNILLVHFFPAETHPLKAGRILIQRKEELNIQRSRPILARL